MGLLPSRFRMDARDVGSSSPHGGIVPTIADLYGYCDVWESLRSGDTYYMH